MITQERLKELLHYDPGTGVFTYKVRSGRCRVGDVAGTPTKAGYWQICIDYRAHLAHRLAFLWCAGMSPPMVDHINGDKSDNRWCNLRPTDAVANAQNQRRARCDSGFLGVHWSTRANKWRAAIKPPGEKLKHLGLFDDPAEAHQAYLNAKRALHAGNTI